MVPHSSVPEPERSSTYLILWVLQCQVNSNMRSYKSGPSGDQNISWHITLLAAFSDHQKLVYEIGQAMAHDAP